MSALRKILYCTLVLCACCACNRRPKDVLSRSTMRDVLIDLHKTEGLIAAKRYQGEQKDACYQSILADYGITQAEFDSSLVWYSSKPKVFERIYQDVLETLQAENEVVAMALKQQRTHRNAQKPELAFLDSLTPKILTQLPDSQLVYLNILLGTYHEPEPEPFALRSIYQIQLQDSIFNVIQEAEAAEKAATATKAEKKRNSDKKQSGQKSGNATATQRGLMQRQEQQDVTAK